MMSTAPLTSPAAYLSQTSCERWADTAVRDLEVLLKLAHLCIAFSLAALCLLKGFSCRDHHSSSAG